MLAIKSVDDEEELNNLRLTEELNIADYLYILKYSKQMLYVCPDGEMMLGNLPEKLEAIKKQNKLLQEEINSLEEILDSINRVVV